MSQVGGSGKKTLFALSTVSYWTILADLDLSYGRDKIYFILAVYFHRLNVKNNVIGSDGSARS